MCGAILNRNATFSGIFAVSSVGTIIITVQSTASFQSSRKTFPKIKSDKIKISQIIISPTIKTRITFLSTLFSLSSCAFSEIAPLNSIITVKIIP